MSGQDTHAAIDRWKRLAAEHLEVKAKLAQSDDLSEEEDSALTERLEELERRLLLFPAPIDWVLAEKFALFRSVLGIADFVIFHDRRELVFLAALKADAVRLAPAVE